MTLAQVAIRDLLSRQRLSVRSVVLVERSSQKKLKGSKENFGLQLLLALGSFSPRAKARERNAESIVCVNVNKVAYRTPPLSLPPTSP